MSTCRVFSRLVLFSLVALPVAATALAAQPGSADEKAVVARVQALFDGLGKRDKAAMAALLLPTGSATLMRNGKPVQMTFDVLLDRLSAPGTDEHEERIHNPLVRIDNDIAVVWARFEFLVNGKVDHCGTDLVNLAKIDGQWLITFLGDTSRTDCKK